jgi:hypothetical protein
MNMYKLLGWIINRIRKQVIKLILIRFLKKLNLQSRSKSHKYLVLVRTKQKYPALFMILILLNTTIKLGWSKGELPDTPVTSTSVGIFICWKVSVWIVTGFTSSHVWWGRSDYIVFEATGQFYFILSRIALF